MTTPTVPEAQHASASPAGRSRPWTIAAFLTQVVYIIWLPLMFALGYLLGDVFGYEPGSESPSGFWARAVLVVVALLVIPLPSWVGVWLAVRARRLGGRAAAVVALLLCALTGLVLTFSSLPL